MAGLVARRQTTAPTPRMMANNAGGTHDDVVIRHAPAVDIGGARRAVLALQIGDLLGRDLSGLAIALAVARAVSGTGADTVTGLAGLAVAGLAGLAGAGTRALSGSRWASSTVEVRRRSRGR